MFDGVGWAAGEIVWFMILATLVGLAIGWIFGRWLQRGVIAAAYENELDAQEELAHKAEYRLIESNQTLDKLQNQLHSQSARVGELEAQLSQTDETIADLEAELAAAGGSDEAYAEIKVQRDEARSAAEEHRSQADHLRGRLDEAESRVADLRDNLAIAVATAAAVPGMHTDLERLETERGQLAARVERLEADLVAANAERGSLQTRVDALESDLASGDDQIDQLERDLAEASEVAASVPELRAGLEKATLERDQMSERVGYLKTELVAARREAATVPGLQADLEHATAGQREMAAHIADLESELDSSRSQIEKLQEDLAALPIPPPTKEQALARIADVAARTAGAGPVPDDDLKEIHGVGPKLEQTLKGFGITSFRQIANFQPGDIAVVTAALNAFKGRIERDDWMASAAALHLEKYNEPV